MLPPVREDEAAAAAYLLLDELDFLENITSCNKVENCVMLSEFEQNLDICKEEEDDKSYEMPEFKRRRSDKKSNRFKRLFNNSSSSSSKRPITVIEENSV